MAFKGTANKSSSGASMSKYDVEVEARLKKLESKAHDDCGSTGGGDAKVDAIIAAAKQAKDSDVEADKKINILLNAIASL